ncbi:Mu transposase domain-containing protein [Dictyobacter kobayashii]|nr:hypothetical protein [Dictyobacter kobayashii]
MWEEERGHLRGVPEGDYECAEIREARVTPYSQVIFETNRYSLPVKRGREQVTVKASAFHVEIVEGVKVLARHERSYEREEDVLDPLHYVGLIKQKPGSFEHALPLKKWKKQWPECYFELLKRLREKWPEGRGVKEFMGIVALHQRYTAQVIELAIKQALAYGCVHVDGVEYCVSELLGGRKEWRQEEKGEARSLGLIWRGMRRS